MDQFKVIVHKDDKDTRLFLASLQGTCFSAHGETKEKAIENLKTVYEMESRKTTNH